MLLPLVSLSLIVAALSQPTPSNSSSVSVSVPIHVPPSATPLASTLLSFSIEQDRWPDWTGTNQRNEFTHAALTRLASLTGTPPKIRVGANSEDHTVWSPTVTINEDEFPTPNSITPYPEATRIVVGNEYYRLSKWLPRGTHMTWGVNLGLDNATNAANMARAILGAFSSPEVKLSGVVLDLIEIGNEADLYSNNGLRPNGYTVQDYVQDWINISTPVANAIQNHPLVGQGPVHIQGCAFAGQGFTPREVFSLGLLSSVPGEKISVISQHRYSAAFCQGGDFPLVSFMSKAAVRGNVTLWEPDIAATKAQGLSYILGETGSIACHGAPGVSNTAGAALWVVDYTLFAASVGIGELHFHEGVGFKYNFIQPVSLNRSIVDGSPLNPPQPPHIQPSFYAALLINSFVSTGAPPFPFPASALAAGSPATQIVELTVDADNVSGYAAFEGGVLRRAVFVNLEAWLNSQEAAGMTRPSVDVDLAFAFTGNDSTVQSLRRGAVQVRRLGVPHADDTANLTWAGQSYEESSDASPTGRLVVETLRVGSGGNLTVSLSASEAVLVTFGV